MTVKTYTQEEVIKILEYIRKYTWTKTRTIEEADFMVSKLTHAINIKIRDVHRDE